VKVNSLVPSGEDVSTTLIMGLAEDLAFDIARDAGLHCIPHAGEMTGSATIWAAIHALRAERIGHGISAVRDPALLKHLADTGIPLEVCAISNLRTNVVRSSQEHPLPRLLDAGVVVTLNTDDPGMFHTDLNSEYLFCHQEFGLGASELADPARNSVRASFAPDELKSRILKEISEHAGQPVGDEGTGHGHVEAVAGSDHRDLDALVQQRQCVRRDAGRLVAQYDDRSFFGGRQVGETDGFVGEFDADHLGAGALLVQPPQRVSCAVHAAGLAERVTAGQCFVDPAERRDDEARADGVARAEECAEVDAVQWPQRGDQQVVPAAVGTGSALLVQLCAGAHVHCHAGGRFAARPEPSTTKMSAPA
jgi:hypothetical protein